MKGRSKQSWREWRIKGSAKSLRIKASGTIKGGRLCRYTAQLRDQDIHAMPTDVCMFFGRGAEFAIERLGARRLTREGARALQDRVEGAALKASFAKQ
jgi:hypothetical protein